MIYPINLAVAHGESDLISSSKVFFLAQLGKKNVFFVYVCRHNTKHN